MRRVVILFIECSLFSVVLSDIAARGGWGLLGSILAGYVPLASQNPFPFIVYFMANYRPHLSYFWVDVILATPT